MLPAVNTLLNAMAENAEFRKLDFTGLRITIGAGMAVHQAVADKWLALTGCPIVEAYGLTETSPAATCNPILIREWSGTIGLPFPSTEIAILDDAGQPVPLGQPGEIAIRGPQVMAGYWQRPDETAKVMTPDGFFKSGDIGIMDERGHTRIVDRKKDMIIVSGFNVFPNEIEAVLALHPGVLECAVIGVPDERAGEAVKAFVVRKDPALTEADLMEYCRQHLTGYKKPKYIEFRDELAEEQHRQDPASRAQGFAGDGGHEERVGGGVTCRSGGRHSIAGGAGLQWCREAGHGQRALSELRMSGIPSCPVCDATDDCRHCLVEWHGWPGERFRGVLVGLIDRIETSVTNLLTECSLAHVPPRHPALGKAYRAALEIVASLRADAESEVEDEEASAQVYWTAPVDREELRIEVQSLAADFAIQCVRQARG